MAAGAVRKSDDRSQADHCQVSFSVQTRCSCGCDQTTIRFTNRLCNDWSSYRCCRQTGRGECSMASQNSRLFCCCALLKLTLSATAVQVRAAQRRLPQMPYSSPVWQASAAEQNSSLPALPNEAVLHLSLANHASGSSQTPIRTV